MKSFLSVSLLSLVLLYSQADALSQPATPSPLWVMCLSGSYLHPDVSRYLDADNANKDDEQHSHHPFQIEENDYLNSTLDRVESFEVDHTYFSIRTPGSSNYTLCYSNNSKFGEDGQVPVWASMVYIYYDGISESCQLLGYY